MTYNGHVENGVIVLDEPAPLSEGMQVRVEVASQPEVLEAGHEATLAERLASLIGKAEGLPADWSENHDAYLREEHRR